MAGALQRDTTKRKPPGGQADDAGRHQTRWVWDGLCICFPLLDPGPAGWREVISGIRPAAVGAVTSGLDEYGQVVVSQDGAANGAANYLEYADMPAHHLPSAALTVYTRFKYNGTTSGGNSIAGKVKVDGTSSTWAIYSNSSPLGALSAVINTSSGENSTGATGVALPTGQYTNAFLRWAAGGVITVDILADGGQALGAQATSGAQTGTLVYSAAPMRIFGSDTARGCGGSFSCLLAWSRRLTDQECAAVAADPFLPYRRPPWSAAQLALAASGRVYRPRSPRWSM